MDSDGDLDLAVGNSGGVNRLYRNEGGEGFAELEGALGPVADWTHSVAWGDMDGDGDLDLAVGNWWRVNRLYRNEGGGTFAELECALGLAYDTTESVAWGDMDGDGDLDLAVGNNEQVNRLYRNEGEGTFAEVEGALGPAADNTESVAWGDIDGDGDLDLAVGNSYGQMNRMYLNPRQERQDLPNNVLSLGSTAPYTSSANFYASPATLDSQFISFTYTLFDSEGDLVGGIRASYSPNGGGQWLPAVATTDTITTHLSTGRWFDRAVLTPTQAILDTGVPFHASLAITDDAEIAEVQVWVAITHTNNADLAAAVRSPVGIQVPLFTVGQASGQNFAYTRFADDVTTTLVVSGAAPYTGTYRPIGRLADFKGQAISGTWTLVITDSAGGGSGTLAAWGLRLKTPPAPHVYTWDTFASGFFGQSDNVVLRMVAHPQPPTQAISGTYKYYNAVPGPFQRPYASVTTFPFCVRGTQVRVYSETVAISNTVSNALVYHLPEGHNTGGLLLADSGGISFRTDPYGYLQGRGEIVLGDQLLALLPVHTALNYEGALEFDGENDYVIKNPLNNGPITTTTVSFWMRSEDTTGAGTPFSYASPLTDDTFLVTDYNDFTIYRGDGISITTGISVTDSAWYHIAVTWRSSDGQVRLYKGGVAAYTGTLAAGSIISPGGSLVLGKDQNREGFFEGTLDEVRVWNVARTAAEIRADMYRSLQGDEMGLVAYWPFNDLAHLALDQTANDNEATLYGATWTGEFYGGYTVYHASAAPTETGLDMFTVTEPGVQVLTVTAEHPLVLFDLNVSLEWDARQDTTFLDQLSYDLRRTSELLYDWSNGQAALGQITVYHDRAHWNDAHIRVYASNRVRPNAYQGGIVSQIITDPLASDLTYVPGQVRMGATWNRYGDPGGSLGEDWPRTLAHELGHYALFLNDNYLGLDAEGHLISVDSCTGTAMTDPYREDYSEFRSDEGWLPGCEQTLSHRSTGRSDWATITTLYPWLKGVPTNPGPSRLPLVVTQIQFVEPITPSTALEVPIFYLSQDEEHIQPGGSARAFLLRKEGDQLIDLGRPTLDRVLAWGAREGDRLCVFELGAQRLGCEIIQPGDEELELVALPDWQPEVIISPVTSRTMALTVTNVPTGLALNARLFPVSAPASPTATLTAVADGYAGQLHLEYPAFEGHVQAWVDEGAPRRETITDYAMGGNPGRKLSHFAPRGSPGRKLSHFAPRGSPGRKLSHFAPVLSANGQVMLFGEDLTFEEGEFFTLQAAATLPSPPPWTTVVGQAYRLSASPNAPDLSGTSISFGYLGNEVPPGEEEWLKVYFWDGDVWQPLSTRLDTYHNVASAPTQGAGLYALMSSIEISLHGPGWDMFSYPVQATRPVTDALQSIGGYFATVYGYDAMDETDPWKVYDVTGVPGWVNDLHTLEFGEGYWISVTRAITLYLKGSSGLSVAAEVDSSSLQNPPATYYGMVLTGPGLMPTAGMTVTAWIGDNLCGQGQTLEMGNQVVYSINVFADDLGRAVGCGARGRIVAFKVGSRVMIPTAIWNNNRVWKLPLSSGFRVYLPLIIKGR
jgi:subtilisin-like proprotein convertase family protein